MSVFRMVGSRELRVGLAALLLALASAGWAQDDDAAAPSDRRRGTLKEVQGQVSVVSGAQSRAAVPGDGVAEGERIVTGSDGAASLMLRDGTLMTVGPNSQMRLRRFEFEPTTQKGSVTVDLLQGTLRMVTGLIAKVQPEQVKVHTPTAVVGIRGTDFIVEANP